MRSSLVIISSYVRMLRTSLAENASHGMGERANATRASSAERASKRNPATTQPGLGVDLLRMNGSGVAASTVRIVDLIVMPPLQRRRDIGRHAVSLDVTEERVRESQGFSTRRRRGAETACSECESGGTRETHFPIGL